MQELAGRLTALDAEGVQTLKVISYFDALTSNGAGLESIVRGAAILTGVPAGAETARRTVRVDERGHRTLEHGGAGTWPGIAHPGKPRVWIERSGDPHANDAMVLERFALAVAVVEEARSGTPPGSIEALIDSELDSTARSAAARRLNLDPGAPIRIWACSPDVILPMRSTVIPAAAGLIRTAITADTAHKQLGVRVGGALAETPDSAPGAWSDAQLALRLADAPDAVCVAEDLGAMLLLARAFDPSAPLPSDVQSILELDAQALKILEVLVRSESVRHAATTLGMHHSSVQSRQRSLVNRLGYDPRTPEGRPRFEAAHLLCRLVRAR